MTSKHSGRRSALLLALALGVTALAGGCGGPPRAEVHGKVTLDGNPIADGSIEFFPVEGKGQTAAIPIKNGEYELKNVSVCKMKVCVNAVVVVSKHRTYENDPNSPMTEVVKNVIPAKYNTSSELTIDLVAGPNEKNFDLKSDAKK